MRERWNPAISRGAERGARATLAPGASNGQAPCAEQQTSWKTPQDLKSDTTNWGLGCVWLPQAAFQGLCNLIKKGGLAAQLFYPVPWSSNTGTVLVYIFGKILKPYTKGIVGFFFFFSCLGLCQGNQVSASRTLPVPSEGKVALVLSHGAPLWCRTCRFAASSHRSCTIIVPDLLCKSKRGKTMLFISSSVP